MDKKLIEKLITEDNVCVYCGKDVGQSAKPLEYCEGFVYADFRCDCGKSFSVRYSPTLVFNTENDDSYVIDYKDDGWGKVNLTKG